MKKLISLVLTLCLAASFAACSNDSADTTAADKDTAAATEAATDAATDAETDAETEAATEAVTDAETEAPAEDEASIYSTWKTSLDISEMMNQLYAMLLEGITLPAITGLAFELEFEFNENGTFKCAVSEDSAKAAIENAKPSLVAFFEALYTAMADQSGITLEEALAASGIESIDALIEQEFNTSDMAEGFTNEGKFLIEDNKLYMGEDENGEIDKTQYIVFTLENGKLTFTEVVGGDEEGSDMFSDFLPLVFEKK